MSTLPKEQGVYVQLRRLADFITKTRQELASLRPSDVKQEFIVKATDELDAIVESTASATHRIMDAADVIMDVAGRMTKEDSDKAMAAVNSIYEACTFQDITGQRVTKVVTMLKVIEERIDAMVSAIGDLMPAESGPAGSKAVATAPAGSPSPGKGSTLEGPQLPGQGTSQADIDKILAGMD